MTTTLFDEDGFASRHIGPRDRDVDSMLGTIGVTSFDRLIDETIPQAIRLKAEPDLTAPVSEYGFVEGLRSIARNNKVLKSYLGQGYYGSITPSVIQRNVFENPGWYTQYTPYQPEISQGRLEALLNFQTMVMEMTGMEVANASLLDEGTAAAEAMTMLHGIVNKKTQGSPADKVFVSDTCFVQTIAVIKTRASAVGIEVVVGNHQNASLDQSYFAAIVQYPAQDGAVYDFRTFIRDAHASGALVIVASDLLSLALLTPPGEFDADVVVGNSQHFGIPMGYGGPHAGFFATKNEYIRNLPGRVIGVSVDAQNNRAYRMALQTREQHIRREKATSNICTAQALLAIMAGMYAIYHGPEGIRKIATRIRAYAEILEHELRFLGFTQLNGVYFDTLKVAAPDAATARTIHLAAVQAGYNFRAIDEIHIGISLDETTHAGDIETIVALFARAKGTTFQNPKMFEGYTPTVKFTEPFRRTSPYLQHPVFNNYHSETEMMRYIKGLENRDLSLAYSMIPLGSCTMKLNAATELMPVSWPEFAHLHPFAPVDQAEGYQQIFAELEEDLCAMTGFAAASLQPNSGAQGEFAGLMVIRAYHHDRDHGYRNVALIPSSAHGTNPASAVMAGFKVVVVHCDAQGNIDLDDLRAKAGAHKDALATLMVTYPSTHGVFEERIKESLYGWRKSQRAGRTHKSRSDRRGRVPHQSPQDIWYSPWRRRSGNGAYLCCTSSGSLPAGPSGGEGRRIQAHSCSLIGTVGESQHPSDFLCLHQDAWPEGCNGCDEVCDPQRKLPEGTFAKPLSGSIPGKERTGWSRVHTEYERIQGTSRYRGRGYRQEVDGLWIPRSNGLLPGARHIDD
jgi:glycine dehydrogenase